MHELSIALSIVEVAGEEATKHGGARIVAVHLKVGTLSGVFKQALESAFELARENTPLADAELRIEETPVRIRCPRCRGDRPILSLQEFVCAECGTPSADVTQGRELEITALEVE